MRGDSDPAWSPAGTRIVFDRVLGFFVSGIYVMNADGSGQTQLTSGFNDLYPAWSPDGTKIAFVREPSVPGAPDNVWVMNADGSGQTQLSSIGGFACCPNWSPDGTKIAFQRTPGGGIGSDIYVMNANGTGVTNLTNTATDNAHPAWSPDGTKIAFQSARATVVTSQIYTMNADGSGVTRLTTNAASDSSPDWGKVPDPALHITRIAARANDERQAAAGVTFTDDDPAGNLSQYSGTIAWGDGSTTTIPKNFFTTIPGGGFAAGGLHTYAQPGSYVVTVTIKDVGGASDSKSTTLVVPSG
jgi:dipeptidyl aminopeptidase/acylaminoacyl peptidase